MTQPPPPWSFPFQSRPTATRPSVAQSDLSGSSTSWPQDPDGIVRPSPDVLRPPPLKRLRHGPVRPPLPNPISCLALASPPTPGIVHPSYSTSPLVPPFPSSVPNAPSLAPPSASLSRSSIPRILVNVAYRFVQLLAHTLNISLLLHLLIRLLFFRPL